MNKILRIACSLALMVSASAANADIVFRAAPSEPAPFISNIVLYKNFGEFLKDESGGELSIQVIGPEIADGRGMKSALDSGLIDIGNLLPLMQPSALPQTASMGELAMAGINPQAIAAAMTDYILNCAKCVAEFDKNGWVFVGSNSTDIYVLATTKPVRTLADLQGMRIRSPGAPYARWAESVGAAPVSIPFSETYEAMTQGVIDGAMVSVNALVDMRLMDVAKYVIEIPLGAYTPTSNFTVRKAAWNKMTDDQKRVFIRAADRSSTAYVQVGYLDSAVRARKASADKSIEFIVPEEEVLKHTRDFVASQIEHIPDLMKNDYGIEDGAEKVSSYVSLLEKWVPFVEEAAGDWEKLAARRYEQIWDKVDLATYGK